MASPIPPLLDTEEFGSSRQCQPWKLTAVILFPRQLPRSRRNQQAAAGFRRFARIYLKMAGQTDSEFRSVAITETSRNLVC